MQGVPTLCYNACQGYHLRHPMIRRLYDLCKTRSKRSLTGDRVAKSGLVTPVVGRYTRTDRVGGAICATTSGHQTNKQDVHHECTRLRGHPMAYIKTRPVPPAIQWAGIEEEASQHGADTPIIYFNPIHLLTTSILWFPP